MIMDQIYGGVYSPQSYFCIFSDDNSRAHVYSSLYHPQGPGWHWAETRGGKCLGLASDRDYVTYEIAARRVLDSRADTLL